MVPPTAVLDAPATADAEVVTDDDFELDMRVVEATTPLIGVHLMEGRQAEIIAHRLHGHRTQARLILAQSTTTQPWEQDVAACLHLMCIQREDELTAPSDAVPAIVAATARYTGRPRIAGYASYHARLGLTITTLAHPTLPAAATALLAWIARDAINSADGYAARDVLGFHEPIDGITDNQRSDLNRLAHEAGLGIGTLPPPILQRLTTSTDQATDVLDSALSNRYRRTPDAAAGLDRRFAPTADAS